MVYEEVLLVEATGADVLGDSDKAVISVSSLLKFIVVDEWLTYRDGVVATYTFSVVPLDETEAADSIGEVIVVIGVTVVLILKYVE